MSTEHCAGIIPGLFPLQDSLFVERLNASPDGTLVLKVFERDVNTPEPLLRVDVAKINGRIEISDACQRFVFREQTGDIVSYYFVIGTTDALTPGSYNITIYVRSLGMHARWVPSTRILNVPYTTMSVVDRFNPTALTATSDKLRLPADVTEISVKFPGEFTHKPQAVLADVRLSTLPVEPPIIVNINYLSRNGFHAQFSRPIPGSDFDLYWAAWA